MLDEGSQPKEANDIAKFRLLMWKNFLQQWRHKVVTLVELLLPVMTMAMVLSIRGLLKPQDLDTFRYQRISAHSLEYSREILSRMNRTHLSIAYSPTSPELEDVVRSAFANLWVHNKEIITGLLPIQLPPGINDTELADVFKQWFSVDAYSNSDELTGIYGEENAVERVIAAVEFNDELFGATELPNSISYSLRFPHRPRLRLFLVRGGSSWRTTEVFQPERTGPRESGSSEGGEDPGYVNEMFIALQDAVSSELVSRITGEDVRNFNINLQRYPHPGYVRDFANAMLTTMLPLFILIAFSYSAINIVRAIVTEKEHHLKELMKMMGVSTWLLWMSWFCKQFIYLIVSTILIVILLKTRFFSNDDGSASFAVITNTPWTLIMFTLMVYVVCMIFFCFMISSMFSKASTATLFTGIIWFISWLPANLVALLETESPGLQFLSCLSINSAMTYGFEILLTMEEGGGIQWGNLMSSPAQSSFVFGHVIIMLIIDCVIYMLLALYLEQVLPGQYGAPKPWYFPFQLHFWCPSRVKPAEPVCYSNEDYEVLKEEEPEGHNIGVQINKLRKVYGNNVVVDRISLNIYDDQITVLLGHNGAGKSTTISMLTGNVEITDGSATLAGYDITQQTQLARANLGLCQQHNVLFDELTVREHLRFFASLKGLQGKELAYDIETLVEKLELGEKLDCQSNGLSGGQKRRLCVGIALSGGARVVLLDEPTSGMDPASRRALWDLLQKEKQGRSLILTTHFMDEADYLGDRVAIMAHGRLQCVGSPQFLKRTHGVGYALVLVKDAGFDYDKSQEIINKHIPGTTIRDDRGSEITYNLLDEHSLQFEALFEDLERNQQEIKFKNIGVTATTLEDVFMSTGSDVEPINSVASVSNTVGSTGDSLDELTRVTESDDNITGWRLVSQHVLAMWLKLWLVWSRSWVLLLIQILVPVLMYTGNIGVILFIISVLSGDDNFQSRALTLAEGYSNTETLVNYMGDVSTSVGAQARLAYESLFAEHENMNFTNVNLPLDEYYLTRAPNVAAVRDIRYSIVTGATFEDDSATAWFSNFGYHDVAVSLNMVHSALLRAFDPTARLQVHNSPLEAASRARDDEINLQAYILSMQISGSIGSSLAIMSATFVMFYIRERVSGAKLLQLAAGVQPVVMWGAAAALDWLWFIITCLSFIITSAAFGLDGLSTFAQLGRVFLCIMIYGAAMLPLNYLFSHVFKTPAMGFVVMFFINTILGSLGPQYVELMRNLNTNEAGAVALDVLFGFLPLYSLVQSVSILTDGEIAREMCLASCDSSAILNPGVITECNLENMCKVMPSCCLPEGGHFSLNEYGIMKYILRMLSSGALFWLLLMIVEYRVVQRIFEYEPLRPLGDWIFRRRTPPPTNRSTIDEDVADEEIHAERIGRGNLAQHGLVSRHLAKYYGKKLAVNRVSFTVNDGECFGLLGVNGAGKTTTFKMLMGDESISSGDAYVSGYSVRKQLTQVQNNIGYCPQFDALFNELTLRETLRLFSMLRGLHAQTAELQMVATAQTLSFLPHLDKRVNQCSGGTKRKLNTALALLGGMRLLFVDEPTTGVDPAAKRHVWRALRNAQRSGRGVVLTSHSMEECEALCSRLTIMVNGRFQCIGTPQHLKNKFSQGYTLKIKIRSQLGGSSALTSATETVKSYVSSNFAEPKLMEDYSGILTYYLRDQVPWSKMFGIMERAKQGLQVEYYNISQTTLEQIFLQFTKYSQSIS